MKTQIEPARTPTLSPLMELVAHAEGVLTRNQPLIHDDVVKTFRSTAS